MGAGDLGRFGGMIVVLFKSEVYLSDKFYFFFGSEMLLFICRDI
jgi:hypothetical protein